MVNAARRFDFARAGGVALAAAAALAAVAGCPGKEPYYLDDGAGGTLTSTSQSSSSQGSAAGPTTSSSSGQGGDGGDACAGVTCVALDACHVAGACNPANGQCSDPVGNDGAQCDDGDACTIMDACRHGACIGLPTMCPGDACNMPGACDPQTGACAAATPAPDATPCPCGACSAGVCGATLLGTTAIGPGTPQPDTIAVDGLHLYFANLYAGFAGEASVGWLPKVGGANIPLDTGLTNASGVTVSAGIVYFTDDSGIWSMPVNQSTGTTLLLANQPTGQRYTNLATDDVNVYATDPFGGAVTAVSIATGAMTPLATGQESPEAIVTDGVNVYWIDSTPAIMQQPVVGGTITPIVPLGVEGLATDGVNVYFADVSGNIGFVPVGGGQVTTLASGQPNPRGITVTASAVYWTNYNDGSNGSVSKIALVGGNGMAQQIPGSLAVAPLAITHDAQCIYWFDIGSAEAFSAPQ
jgi:hypothetical protein